MARDHRTAPKKQFQINQGFLSVCVSCGQVLLAIPKSDFRAVFPQPLSVMAGLFEGGLTLAGDSSCFVLAGRVCWRRAERGQALLFLHRHFPF